MRAERTRREESGWIETWAAVCRRHLDLVSVHESPRGRLALLLRQEPPAPGRRGPRQVRSILRSGARVITELRAAGVRADMVLLQLRPLSEIAYVLHRWPCRYDGDPRRRRALAATAQLRTARHRYVVAGGRRTGRPETAALTPTDTDATARSEHARGLQTTVIDWYNDMTSTWLSVEPRLRRQLVLRVHQWIAERVFVDGAVPATPLEDLGPGGPLAAALAVMVPADQTDSWQPWIRRVLHDFRDALRRPPSQRTGLWCRRLFLIPYSAPVGPQRPRGSRVLAGPFPGTRTPVAVPTVPARGRSAFQAASRSERTSWSTRARPAASRAPRRSTTCVMSLRET